MQDFKINFPVKYGYIGRLDDSIDANLIFPDGKVYVATLYTISNIQRLMTKENMPSFYDVEMVIVRDMDRLTIRHALEEVVDRGVERRLTYIGHVEDKYELTYEEMVDETTEAGWPYKPAQPPGDLLYSLHS